MKTERVSLSTAFGIVVALLGVALPTLAAQASPPADSGLLTLEQAISQAIAQNRPLKVAELDLEKARESTLSARTHYFPEIKFTFLGSQQLAPIDFYFAQGIFGHDGQGNPIPAEDTYISTDRVPTGVLQGQVLQPLTQLYKLKLNVKTLKMGEEVAHQEVRLKIQDLVKNVKLSYWQISQAQAGIRSLEETIRLYRELDRLTTEYLAQEVVLKGDLLQVKTGLAKAEYDLQCQRDTMASAKEQLNLLLGRDPLTEFSVEETPAPSSYETDLAAARQRALEQRAEPAKAKALIEQAEFDRRAKKAEYIPDLGVALNYTRLVNYNEMLPSQMCGLGLMFSWEIYDWGRKKHDLKGKERVVEQAKLGLKEAHDAVVLDVNEKYRKLRQNRLLLETASLNRETAAEQLRVMKDRFKQEAALVKDVLQAQTNLEDAETSYRDAIIAFWAARAEFEKALGEEK